MEPWVFTTAAVLFGFFTGLGLGSVAGFAAGFCITAMTGLVLGPVENILVMADSGPRTTLVLGAMFGLGWVFGLVVRSDSETS